MRILLYHPVRLPARDYGGVERVVLWLAKGLVELGHQVGIACLSESQILPEYKHLKISGELKSSRIFFERLQSQDWDAIHLMAPVSEVELGVWASKTILTVHGNGKPGEVFSRNSVFLTKNHANRHQSEVFVYNGLDPEELIYTEVKGQRILFLSKTSWSVKNLAGAMRIASRAHLKLDVAGGSRPLFLRLRSWLSGYDWHGPVSGRTKAKLLADARVLIFPVIWPEPFGLVVIEALFSGTPVIGLNRGGLQELVSSEVGRLFDTEDEMSAFLAKPFKFDARVCRQWALSRFHYVLMAKNYVEIYQKVLMGSVLNSFHPVAADWKLQK